MFIGRRMELEKLDRLWKKGNFQLVVVYGRRRVGKTTLLKKFSEGKNSIFFVCDEVNEKVMLDSFSKFVLEHFGLSETIAPFESWEKVFRFIGERARKEQLLLVIDEFPYMVNASPEVPSLLQRMIDHEFANSKLFIALCGSSIGFMEKEVLGSKSPLFGRRTAQFKIEPFNYLEASNFFPSLGAEEKVITYGILGGVPQYLLKWDEALSIKQNIMNNFLDTSAYLYEEPRFLLKQELREPALYNAIIETIAFGASRLNDIANKIGQRNDKTGKYIKILMELEIVGKEIPVTEKENSKKSLYFIRDELFRFWYTFIFPNRTLVETGMSEYILNSKILPGLSEYTGKTFERVCADFVKRKNAKGEFTVRLEKIGRWWGNNPFKKRQEEIDIVGLGNEGMLFGECKWQNRKVDISDLNKLVEKSELFNTEKKIYVLFSKSGFTYKLLERAKNDETIRLYTLEELFE
ncbi:MULTISPECIES: ATP-binding protein [Kosmotoga]|uniref:ATPase n=1 Tax=Kosmotoga olearia (strain ATCC BAA-1733 / DSM 21960 / TBF 19.5.1) TaxID=521045 RepID=C5CE95_KOSOT|nr:MULTISPECIES: ATP-binding protein [Kosmotoga]ACR79213.1 ATPase [Kosmotoga olearia TBF 19.5.1]OAA23710.1 ATPase [Kosmotoga sp. DU53]